VSASPLVGDAMRRFLLFDRFWKDVAPCRIGLGKAEVGRSIRPHRTTGEE
jgi:hypothetical protein